MDEDPPLQHPGWLYTLAGIPLTAGIGIIPIDGFFCIGLRLAMIGVLALVGIWFRTRVAARYVVVILVILSCFAIPFYNWLATSPISRTLTLHDMNNSPEGYWEGPKDEALNLTTQGALIARLRLQNQAYYVFRPAIRHTSDGVKGRIIFTIRIPNVNQFTPRSWMLPGHGWTLTSGDGYKEYATVIENVESSQLYQTPMFEFQRKQPGSYEISYRINGVDTRGRLLKRKDSLIKVEVK